MSNAKYIQILHHLGIFNTALGGLNCLDTFQLLGEARTGQGRDWARDGPEKATDGVAWLKASSCTVGPWQACENIT